MQYYRFKDAEQSSFPEQPSFEYVDKHITQNSSVGIAMVPRRALGHNEIARVLRYDGMTAEFVTLKIS